MAMANASRARILVIDDASLVRLYYRDALERAGFEVDQAVNGLEGLEKLLAAPPDLVIVDVNMPRMDGLSFLKTLRRREPPVCFLPALVTSSEGASRDIDAARLAGANFYLVKPIAQEILADYVAMMCGRLA